MRPITTHQESEDDNTIALFAQDEPGPGGANHVYAASVQGDNPCIIRFQKGPIGEAGPNGISNETLLAVVIDRLQAFQAGPYACKENAEALRAAESAMFWSHARTQRRRTAGIEGTSAVKSDDEENQNEAISHTGA